MNTLLRPLLGLALLWLVFVLFGEARSALSKPEVDSSTVVLLFGAVVAVGTALGVVFVLIFLPRLGDAIGNLFFNPSAPVERPRHAAALSAVARGHYPAAIAAYRQALAAEPDDVLAVGEITQLYCDKLHDPVTAAAFLEEALERGWPAGDAAFLGSRLADVYWKYQHDAPRARATLRHIIRSLPATKHAANAQHRLDEIDRQLAARG